MDIALIALISINILAVVGMIFIERKRPTQIVTWTTIMFFLPIFGFVLYVLIGGGLSITTRLRIRRKKLYSKDYSSFIEWQNEGLKLKNYRKSELGTISSMVLFNNNFSESALICGNSVEIFTNGVDKITKLKKDLLLAKSSINIEYYIFASDKVGKQIMAILCKKAREGVKVKLIYDSVGSLRTSKRFFKKLVKCGGEVAEFFPPFMHIRLINLKLNYRNHRKIVVIDGKIAYTGGINIRDDHMGERKKLSPWRDTHIRLVGRAVYNLQNSFFNDWRFCKKDKSEARDLIKQGYFPDIHSRGDVAVQVVTSGPESSHQAIKYSLIKAIGLAQKRIVLQSPYFVPDDAFLDAIKLAHLSGVEVILMLPQKADKKIVHSASLSYAKDLVELGIKVYLYNGFLHSKALLIDNTILSIGTCNADNRSFALNFELNCFIYGSVPIMQYEKIIEQDIESSKLVDINFFRRKPFYTKLGQAIFRLFSPLL